VESCQPQRLVLLLVLLVVLPACSPTNSDGTRDVRVTLTEFSIRASEQSFTVGAPYRLVITNLGQVNHELRIAPPGVQGGPGVIASVDEMTLQPGTTQVVDVTFPESVARTGLEFACHLPAHYDFGMHLAVTAR
jgi:uncharacterized cupredoxin-like copper-binding protein